MQTPAEEVSTRAPIHQTGRQRPKAFKNAVEEASFVTCIAMSQFLTEYFVSGFTLILPTVIRELDVPQSAAIWPASAFSLAVATTLLIFGRLCDRVGGRPIFLSGLLWLTAWSVIAGFSSDALMLDICRALQGLGAAAILPSGVMLLGSIYRPGPRKNMVFSIYGTSAVLGFLGGILLGGVVGQYLRWGYYFWIGGSISGFTFCVSALVTSRNKITNPREISKQRSMDYPGAMLICTGWIMIVFAVIQSTHALSGWRTPYIPTCFGVGVLALTFALYYEFGLASDPILPRDVFSVPSLTPLLFAIFLLYGCWGIFSVYGTLYFQNILLVQPLQVAVWYVPLGVAGLLFGIIEGYILHMISGRALLILSALAAVGSQLLLALLPLEGWSYWAWIFPATILSTIGIDIPTILFTVFITTKLPLVQQGLAGGVLNSVLQLGVAVCLGLADTIQSATVSRDGFEKSYKNTFWLGVCAASLSLIVMAVFCKVPRAESELHDGEE